MPRSSTNVITTATCPGRPGRSGVVVRPFALAQSFSPPTTRVILEQVGVGLEFTTAFATTGMGVVLGASSGRFQKSGQWQ